MSIIGDATDVRNYFDQDTILSKWGFDDNVCYYCGILNSDINGLLMQCGKCKKGKETIKNERKSIVTFKRKNTYRVHSLFFLLFDSIYLFLVM
jgi:hypothetical protein